MRIKIAAAQSNPIVGDLGRNLAMILQEYALARKEHPDATFVVFPECALTGYPLDDLVLRESFLHKVGIAAQTINNTILTQKDGPVLIYGSPVKDAAGIRNAAYIVDPKGYGSVSYITKTELPNYGVFDEKRHFVANPAPHAVTVRGHKIGLMICEDCWFPRVSKALKDDGAEILIAINGSPFEMGKNVVRHNVVKERVQETGLPFVYVNLVGGQDELVFDGDSFSIGGSWRGYGRAFKACTDAFVVDIGQPVDASACEAPAPSGIAEIYDALVLGTRDYLTKQGFRSVVIGYSGGVDSGLVAAIAVDALGSEAVHLVRLPSKFSSEGSLTDAEAGAAGLYVTNLRTISIEPVVKALREAHESANRGALRGVADENIQARARGNILMAISNQEGHMLLTTGNKSEVSVGYSTLYGDMAGGFNPIKDCYKTTVWDLCRYRNRLGTDDLLRRGYRGPIAEVVPEAIINKPPSAELRANQKDEDSLPPYPVLDGILKLMIEKDFGVEEVVERGFDRDVVQRVQNLVDNAEYKRRQAAPGVKITSKLYGRERRYPIVNAWRG